MMCYLARIIGGAVMLALTATAIAATPPERWFSGQRLALEQLDRTQYAALDLEQLALEDQFNEALGQPPRFAVGREIAISPFNAGTWTETRESSIWRYRVTAEQAVSLNFGFDNVHLPPQARLYIYTVDAALRGEMDRFEVLGPYGPEINESHRQFWTPIVVGDDVVIELNVPHDQRARVLLNWCGSTRVIVRSAAPRCNTVSRMPFLVTASRTRPVARPAATAANRGRATWMSHVWPQMIRGTTRGARSAPTRATASPPAPARY